MTKYKIIVYESSGMFRHEETTDIKRVNELKRAAHDRAVKCLPFSQYNAEFRHLIYYYELPGPDYVSVSIREDIPLMNDTDFYGFVDYWKPIYVGAIHRHE